MAFNSIMSSRSVSGETADSGFQYIIAGSTSENQIFSIAGQSLSVVANTPDNASPSIIAPGKVSPDEIVQDTRTNVDAAVVRNIDNSTAVAALTLPSVSAAAPVLTAGGGAKAEPAGEPSVSATAADTAFAGSVNISVKSPAGNSTEYNIPAVSGSEAATADSVSGYVSGITLSGSPAVSGVSATIANYRVDNTSFRAIDADKWNVGDIDLCWAATASNMLYWAGWGKNTSLSVSYEDDLLDYYKEYFTDVGGYIDSGIKWFLSGQYDCQGLATVSQLKKSGGGGFSRLLQFQMLSKLTQRR